MKLYIALDDFDSRSAAKLAAKYDVTIRQTSKRASREELLELSAEFDAIIIGAAEKVTSEMVVPRGRVRLIGTTSVGLDHIDDEVRRRAEVEVVNTPSANVATVAEHVFGLIIAHHRKLPLALEAGRGGRGREAVGGGLRDLNGQRLGVVGAGAIGRATCRLGLAFGMQVMAATRTPSAHADLLGVEFVDIERVFESCDVITISLPLTHETTGVIGAALLDRLGDAALLVSTSRFEIFNEFDFKSSFRDAKYSIALDGKIPSSFLEEFHESPRLMVTPHTAGVTRDAVGRMDAEIAEQFLNIARRR